MDHPCCKAYPSDLRDGEGAILVPLVLAVKPGGPELPCLCLVWADAGYSGQLARDLRQQLGWMLEVVKRRDTQPRSRSRKGTLL